ncbi:hypothetical protein FF1_042639 [Malus domestica]
MPSTEIEAVPRKSQWRSLWMYGKRASRGKASIGGVPLQVVVVTRNLHGSSKIQFDLDDYHVQKGPHDVDTENIKMSMFSDQKDDDRDYDGKGRGGRFVLLMIKKT